MQQVKTMHGGAIALFLICVSATHGAVDEYKGQNSSQKELAQEDSVVPALDAISLNVQVQQRVNEHPLSMEMVAAYQPGRSVLYSGEFPSIPMVHPYNPILYIPFSVDGLPLEKVSHVFPDSLKNLFVGSRPRLSLSALRFLESGPVPILSRSHHVLHKGAGSNVYNFAFCVGLKGATQKMSCTAYTHGQDRELIASPNSGSIGLVKDLEGQVIFGLTNKNYLAIHLILTEADSVFFAQPEISTLSLREVALWAMNAEGISPHIARFFELLVCEKNYLDTECDNLSE